MLVALRGTSQSLLELRADIGNETLSPCWRCGSQVVTVRDFSLIFDALTTFETSLLEARISAGGDDGDGSDKDDGSAGTSFLLRDAGSDADLRHASRHAVALTPSVTFLTCALVNGRDAPVLFSLATTAAVPLSVLMVLGSPGTWLTAVTERPSGCGLQAGKAGAFEQSTAHHAFQRDVAAESAQCARMA